MKLIFLLLFGDFAFEANPSQKSTFIRKVNENGTITKKVYGVKTITTVKNVFWQLILEVYVCALNYFKGRSSFRATLWVPYGPINLQKKSP